MRHGTWTSLAYGLSIVAALLAVVMAPSDATAPSDTETRIALIDQTLDDGIDCRALVMVSPPAVPTTPSASEVVRYVALTIWFHRNNISPSFSYTMRPMPVDGSDVIAYGVSALAPARVKRCAADELGVELSAEDLAAALGHTQGTDDPMYQIELRPLGGKTWGEVESEDDVQLTVTVEP